MKKIAVVRPAGRRFAVLVTALALAGLLPGCVSLSADRGFEAVADTARARTGGQPAWARTEEQRRQVDQEVAKVLTQVLGPEDAVQVALLANPGLQGMFAELGVAEADLVQAGRLPNPRFRTMRTSADEAFKYETSLTFPVAALITMPAALGMERQRLAAVRLQVTDRVLAVAAETREAWVSAVAAAEQLRWLEQVHDAAEAGAELARRMAAAGNFSRLDRLREEAFAAEVGAQTARARADAVAARERLTRAMGLESTARYRLPERLPELPAAPADDHALEAFALTRRLDLQAARGDADATARALGLTRVRGFVNALELGPARVQEDGEPLKRGYEVSVELPVFDWGSARVARAESVYMQSVARVAQTAVNARSEVRESVVALRSAWEAARLYRDEIMPLRRRISEEHWLRYNGMLMSVFEVLADARDRLGATQGWIGALRDYWVAEARLQRALGGRLPPPPLSTAADGRQEG